MANLKDNGVEMLNRGSCEFCMEEGREANASAYCKNCRKKICDSCLTFHVKFSRDHIVVNSSELLKDDSNLYVPSCDLHVNQKVEFYCQVHECLFCKFCKRLDHKHCDVKTIDDAMKDVNIEHELEVIRKDLIQLNEVLKTKQSENVHQLENISTHKGELRSMVGGLRMEISEVLSTYEHNLEDAENSFLDNLETKMHSFESFREQLESDLQYKGNEREMVNPEIMFFESVKMKRLKKKYTGMIEHVENKTSVPKPFVLQKDKMLELIRKLTAMTDEEYFENGFEHHFPFILKSQKMTNDSQTQTESEHNTKKAAEQTLAENTTNVSASNDEEAHISSEEESGHNIIHIATKPFTSIASCSLVEEKYLKDSPLDNKGYTSLCMMPGGQIVLCQSPSTTVTILNKDMSSKMNISLRSCLGSALVKLTCMEAVLLDSKRVAILLKGSLEEYEKRESRKKFNCIQIISVYPKLEVDNEIKLNDKCEKIACFDEKIYVYLSDLCKSTFIETAGIEILDTKGQLLKIVQLLQPISCFCVSKNGDIIYCGLKAGRTYGRVTKEGVEVYNHPCAVAANQIIPDVNGNILILDFCLGIWGKIAIMKADGSEKRVLMDSNDDEIKVEVQEFNFIYPKDLRWLPTSFCYNNMDNTILIAGFIYNRSGCRDYHSRPLLRLYQLQYTD